MKKKVKKFGVGGDILTGLGAGLAGYALYKKLKGEDKDEKEPESVGGPGRRPRTIEEQTGRKAEPKAESREDYLEKHGAKPIKTTGTFTGSDTAEPNLDRKDTTPKPAAKNVKVKPEAQSKRGLVDEPPAKLGSQGSFKFDSTASRPSTSGVGPKNTFLTKERLDKAQDSMRRYREEQKKKQKGITDTEYDTMGNPIMKKGGKVKKYAEGGKPEPKKDTMPEWAKNERENKKKDELNKRESEGAAKEVKRNMSTFGFKKGGTASSRADGVAQRGKTRGRIY